MAIKFEKIRPGMTLYQKTRVKMGNTMMSRDAVYDVKIVSVDAEKRTALVRWNGNPERVWFEFQLKRLYAKKPETKDPFGTVTRFVP